jgi:hypothetical protein
VSRGLQPTTTNARVRCFACFAFPKNQGS